MSVGQYTAGFQMSHGPTRVLKHNPINAVSTALVGLVGHELGDKSNNYLNDITGIWKNTFSAPG